MAQENGPPSFGDFDERLKRLRGADPRAAEAGASQEGTRPRFGGGFQAGIELVAGIIGGLVLGWALDYWLGTRPLFLILFFLLGAAAGMLNAYRWLQRFNKGDPGRPGA